MSRTPSLALGAAAPAFPEQTTRARELAKVMIALKMATLAATFITFSSPAFAQRSSLYPEGSIFLAPSTRQLSPTMRTTTDGNRARISPLNPLDAPDAGNVWKPSNRDAGNLAAQRWQEFAEKRAAAQHSAQ